MGLSSGSRLVQPTGLESERERGRPSELEKVQTSADLWGPAAHYSERETVQG